MTGYETYIDYLALKRHFTTADYDYHKFNGKIKATPQSYEARKDRWHFEKLAKHKDPHGLILANLIEDPKLYILDLAYSEGCQRTYLNWLKRTQALSVTIRQDLSKLDENFDSNFKVTEQSQFPKLIELYQEKLIIPETICVLVAMVDCIGYWDRKLANDPIWEEIRMFLIKYTPFIRFDREKIKKIVVDLFN